MKHLISTLAGLTLLGTTAYAQQAPPRIIVPPILDNYRLLDVARVPFITETGDLMMSQARRDARREDWLRQYPAPLPHQDEIGQLNWDDTAR